MYVGINTFSCIFIPMRILLSYDEVLLVHTWIKKGLLTISKLSLTRRICLVTSFVSFLVKTVIRRTVFWYKEGAASEMPNSENWSARPKSPRINKYNVFDTMSSMSSIFLRLKILNKCFSFYIWICLQHHYAYFFARKCRIHLYFIETGNSIEYEM